MIDSGKVLNGPITGHWFITPNFFSYVNRKSYSRIPKLKRDKAFSKAGDYISKQNFIINEDDEYKELKCKNHRVIRTLKGIKQLAV